MANSVSELLVAFMFANSYEPSSLRSSYPPASMTLALPESNVSHAISTDCNAVALTNDISMRAVQLQTVTNQAPTGILMGPLEDNSKRLTQPATVLMKLVARLVSSGQETDHSITYVSCRISF